MSYRNSVLNPSASRLVEYIAAILSRAVVHNAHAAAKYELSVKRAVDDTGQPYINFQTILSEDPEYHPILTDKEIQDRKEAIAISRRRVVQVAMKSFNGTEFIVRFGEMDSEGTVFYFTEGKTIAGTSKAEINAMLDMSLTVGNYMANGQVIKIGPA